jgi:hypothetical protein
MFSLFPTSVLAYPNNVEDFNQYLLDHGIQPKSVLKRDANFKTYERYGLVVYGNYWGEQKTLKDGTIEYRYLGYTQTDGNYTNSLFPNDVTGSKTPLQWTTYKNVDKALDSWDKVADADQKAHMLDPLTNLKFQETPYNGLTVNWIGQSKAKLLNPASLKNGFSVFTQHTGADGKLYYATFYGPEMGGGTNVSCLVTTPANTYTIKADQQSVPVPVTVKATANLIGKYVKQKHVKSLIASFKNSISPDIGNILNATTTKADYVILKSDYPSPGTYIVPLTGTATMRSTLSGSDTYTAQATKNINLIIEGNPGAYVEVTATANPAKKQVDGSKDELVTVTVNAALKKYTDTTNINSWTIKAQLDGEDITLQPKNNPGGTLTSSASFTFTVLKSKFIPKNFIQSFKATAIVHLNRAIDGVKYYEGTNYTETEFYKDKPEPDPMPAPELEPEPDPVDPNIHPVAVLGYQETVRAGDETMVDSLSSYDIDGYIAEHNVYTPNANVINTDEGLANVWYPYTGVPTVKYRVAARVKDNRGAANGTTGYITVTEPTIEAKIIVTGKLKVNRHVTIVSASDSPERYPIDNTKTVWTLQAVSGGTNADIKFNGVLTQVNTLNVLFKKQGVYRATLSVTNTLGFTGTTTYLINIGPDLKPVANYESATTVLRDVKDYGYATIELLDTSYSLDGDIIKSRIWSYAWDSNNNGSFADETYKTFDSGNNIKPILKVSTVGKYNIKLLVQETFTDTLPLYILPTDYLSDDTVDKPLTESVVEVINIAPTTAFSMINKKKVDLIFNVWDTKYTTAEIQTKINSTIIPAMSENNIDAQITVNDNYDLGVVTTPINTSEILNSYREDPEETEFVGSSNNLLITGGYSKYSYISTKQINIGDYYAPEYIIGDSYTIGSNVYRTPASTNIRLYNTTANQYIDIATLISDNFHDVSTARFGDITHSNTHTGVIGSNCTRWYFYMHDFTIEDNRLTVTASLYHSEYQRTGYSLAFENVKQTFTIPWDIHNNTNSYKISTYSRVTRKDSTNTSGSMSTTRLGVLTSTDDNSKYMETLLTEYTPRTNSKPYLITVADNQLKELTDPQKSAKILSQTLEKYINFTALGTTTNKTQLENFKISNNNHGTFIDNTNLDAAINSLKDYILGIENHEEPKTQYVVLGEDLEYLTFYDDYEDDVKYAEQWKYTHTNPNYFDNALGIDPQSGINRTLPITKFDRVGLYAASLRVQDNPYNNSLFNNYKLWSKDEAIQLIVHRRPIASFTPYVLYNSATSKYNISTVDKSYDLDHSISRVDKGIIQKQWKWKLAEDIVWQLGIPAEIINGKTYILQLMVQDIEGTWSTPATKIASVPDILLYANPTSLLWQNTNAIVGLGVNVNVGTFNKVEYAWTNNTTKPNIGYASSTSISNNLTQTATGEWYLHAMAYTLEGQSAYNYFGPYQIDKIAPVITPVKTGGVSNTAVTVDVSIADTGGSMIYDVKYRWTNTSSKPTSGWTVTYGSFSAIQNQDKIWYLHIEATDNAGNITYTAVSIPHISINANPTSLPWQNISAVVNLTTTITNGSFSKISYRWTNSITKPTASWTSSTNSNINTTQSSTGIWYLHAETYATGGQSAYNYFGPYLIDKIAPTISVDKTNAESIDPIKVNVTIDDTGGSGIKEIKYKWTNTITKPASGWSIVNDCFSTIQEDEGIWYLHVEATDNAGNITYDYFGIYKIDSFILEKFRVVMVRDLQLEDYYYNNLTGRYDDIPMYVNRMALDDLSFGSMVDGLTKGYKFEFEIDSRNFNEAADTIIIEPHFYTTDGFSRDAAERDLYWEDSSHQIFKIGEGGHASWKTIKLAASNRIIRTDREATWRGEYLIPGSAWAVPKGTMKAQAKAKDLKKDILVNFQIIGYKDGILQFDYNAEQWSKERTTDKYPYLIGDVIRYSWDKNCLDDINAKDNR